MGFVTGLLDDLQVPQAARGRLLELLNEKNAHELHAAALAAGLTGEAADALCGLLQLHGPLGATLTAARQACRSEAQRAALEELQALQNQLGEDGRGTLLDLSLADEMEYYNGLVFTGYVAGVPRAVLKGGRYDYLMQKFTPGPTPSGLPSIWTSWSGSAPRTGTATTERKKSGSTSLCPRGVWATRPTGCWPRPATAPARITTTPASWWWKIPKPGCGISW